VRLVDTSVLVSLEREGRLIEWLGGMPAIAISTVTIAELQRGVLRGASPDAYARVLREADPVPLDVPIAERAADLWVELERAGHLIPAFDLLIGATALERGWPLLTLHAHFERVPGLRVVRPPR
jgi:predicted nucleic acid-binding protein